MNAENKSGGLGDLSRENIKKTEKPKPMTQEEAAQMMANFYSTMANGVINLVAISGAAQQSLSEISIDLNDIAFYIKKLAVKMDAVSIMEIEEHEAAEDEEPPENSNGSL